eukprot:TRINITY_DN1306_c0_g1_i1.p1 TRINITY_DN1306_c0_g1~~TRINITY_DN1306_c0_g1_i1.p1  ORF type:complete len:302 (+),score=86.04 TRINITY_DN1306_c0_g1_i1:91-906(+)
METRSFNFIKGERKGPVAVLTLSRPEKGNAISLDMGAEIKTFIHEVEEDPGIRVLVVTGQGKYFCTGMDLSSSNQETLSQNLHSGDAAHSSYLLFETLKRFSKPIIAKINGPVLAGGLGVMFVADIRIATTDSFFCFAEVKRGIVPALISTYIIPQMGLYQAKKFMLTGERIPSKKALEIGMISEVAENEEQLEKLTNHYLNELLSGGPTAMRKIKELSHYVSCHTHEENVEFAKKIFTQTVHSEEASYGISCFIQKTKPDWSQFAIKSKL